MTGMFGAGKRAYSSVLSQAVKALRMAVFLLLCALPLTLGTFGQAHAHAVLLEASPSDGARLDLAPEEIALRFNELVTPVFINLIGPDGARVSIEDNLPSLSTELRLKLPENLPHGGYIISYRVISADTHPVGGSVTFLVGEGALPTVYEPQGIEERETYWLGAKIVLRSMQNIALLLAAGGVLFLILVVGNSPILPAQRKIVVLGSIVAALASTLGIGVQGGLMMLGTASALFEPATWLTGAHTSAGISTLFLIAGFFLCSLSLFLNHIYARGSLGLMGAALACGSLSVTGHAATGGLFLQALLFLHVLAVAYWIGALWPLNMVLTRLAPQKAELVLERFSTIGIGAVLVLMATGGLTALNHLKSFEALASSPYGQLVLLKVFLVAALVGIALLNRFYLMPALRAREAKARQSLSRNIRFEIALSLFILVLTAFLAHTSPQSVQASLSEDDHSHNHHHHEHHSHKEAGFTHVATVESRGKTLNLSARSLSPGLNSFEMSFTDENGAAVRPMEVRLLISLPDQGIEAISRLPEEANDGSYRLQDISLPLAGQWDIRVDALINDFEKIIFLTELIIE